MNYFIVWRSTWEHFLVSKRHYCLRRTAKFRYMFSINDTFDEKFIYIMCYTCFYRDILLLVSNSKDGPQNSHCYDNQKVLSTYLIKNGDGEMFECLLSWFLIIHFAIILWLKNHWGYIWHIFQNDDNQLNIYLGLHFLRFFCVLLFKNECIATNKKKGILTLTLDGLHLSLKTQNGLSTWSVKCLTTTTFQTSIDF